MQTNYIINIILLFLYYASYIIQPVYISLIIGTLFLVFILFINPIFNLLHFFYLILPSIYKFNLIENSYATGIYFFTYIDITIIAGFLCLIRNIIFIKKIEKKYLFLIYLFVFVFYSIQFILFFDNEITISQGSTYTLKALLYINALFFFNQTSIDKLEKNLKEIIIVSAILYLTTFFSGFYTFFIVSFLPLILKIKKNYYYFIIFLWSSIVLFYKFFNFSLNDLTQSHLLLYLISFLIFLNFHNFILKNKIILFLLFNISFLIFCIIYYFHPVLTEFLNNNYENIFETNNYFYIKLLLDRMPLWLASIEQSNFLFGNFGNLSLDGYKNAVSVTDEWSYGSHNYFIEMCYKAGFVISLSLFLIFNIFLFETASLILKKKTNYVKDGFFIMFYYVLISLFIVWGFVGNSFFENIGLLFYMISGSIYSVFKKF